ncbi:MAG: phenylalanine--tRNA ligase subunit beta [Ilumatobacteraceae bacterium]|nr:phenylalanine--tRNA ligase subunit beta [Ilumatobacteraceae bacterium]
MKVLLSILREYAELPGEPEVIAAALNTLGLAVESTEVVGTAVAGVITARVLRTQKHPEADRVTRVWVDSGDGQEKHVWCGATNMKALDVVALATIGTILPDGRDIARRGILGIDSEGMLCSAIELGLGDDTGGIIIFAPDTPLGRSPFEILEIEHDVLFDLDLTRNRPDCWGHLGVARDLAAYFDVPIKKIASFSPGTSKGASASVDIVRNDRCEMFAVQVISGVVVAPSPNWVVSRLRALGMRSINNVVDASNLVMLELNQPNHAYDADVVNSFRIRCAHEKETLVTLDGITRHLHADDLLICNATDDSAVGLAGVMGGHDSEITHSTTVLALEVAWFAADPIRFTANRHALRSEASARFERGVDPEGVVEALRRFVTILAHTCPSISLRGAPVVANAPNKTLPAVIELRLSAIERTLLVSIDSAQAVRILSSIGFSCVVSSKTKHSKTISVQVPSWRPDCTIEVDLIEEIARHYGYEKIGKRITKSAVHGRLSVFQQRRRELRRVLLGLGLDEAMPSPFLSPGDLALSGLDESNVLVIANPLVTEESILRTSLRPGLLKAIRYNMSHRAERVALWEIGHVYPRGTEALPDETEMLCVLVADADVSEAARQWNTIADALAIGANIEQSRIPEGLHPTRAATLSHGKSIVGVIGEIDPGVLAAFGIDCRVSCLEINLSAVLAEVSKPAQAKDLNRFPSSDIDLSFVLDDTITAMTLQRALRQAAGANLVSIVLFDIYRGAGVEATARSLTFRLRLQKPDDTLTDSDIASLHDKCISAAVKTGAVLRS